MTQVKLPCEMGGHVYFRRVHYGFWYHANSVQGETPNIFNHQAMV